VTRNEVNGNNIYSNCKLGVNQVKGGIGCRILMMTKAIR
jgi:hypothetical protein